MEKGAEAFYKPLLEGMSQTVRKRGWSERIIMLGLGGDKRPSQRDGELMRQWAPYARWDLLSHFSGDPDHKDSKLIATGGLEIGVKGWPWLKEVGATSVQEWAAQVRQPLEFLQLPTDRWKWQEYSPPLVFRTVAIQNGHLGRIGLDFWLSGRDAPTNRSFFQNINALTVAGPDGATPTVRFQMLREGVQEWEARTAILKALADLTEERRQAHVALLDELPRRLAWGSAYLSQHELSYDWPGYVARIYQAAAELAGERTDAAWDKPAQ
jgi:hypothetical protein